MKLHHPKLLLMATAIALGLSVGSTSMVYAEATTAVQAATQHQALKLAPLNWDKFNREQIDKMIAAYGKSSPNYDPKKRPYVVFDWDNTTVFLDIEEAALIYQLENLRFGATPEQLNTAIRMNIPSKDFDEGHHNAAGEPVNIDKIAPDIIESYTWLYNNYSGLKGSMSLEEVKKNPHYMNFITKVRYLYEAIGDTFDHATAYPWVTYLFTGLNEHQVAEITDETVKWQLGEPVEEVKWTSPESMPGKAGVLTVKWKNGLRLVPEMQNLYQVLRDSGIDVWVCSASYIDVIREISSNHKFGYNNPARNAIAMELERDDKGVIQPEFRRGYDQTQGEGKTKAIKRFITPHYQGRGPILVGGDSEGDQNMMVDFGDDTKIVLIINRLRSPKNPIGQYSQTAVDTYGKPDAKFLLQGRDDNKGVFVPSQLHFKLGSTEGKAVR